MIALLAQAHAATWNVPQDFPTIGAAEAGAAAGDTITIDPGFYAEHVHVHEDLVFQGQPGVTWTGTGVDEPIVCEGVACTVREVAFDLNGSTRAIFSQAGADLVVEDCSFVNGSADRGGAIRSSNAASLVVRRSWFDANTVTTSGAAIYATGTPVVEVTSSTMTGGSATIDGGAIRVTNGGSVVFADLWVEGNTAGDDGGGIDVDATPLFEMRRSFLCGNTAVDEGGGFVVRDAESTVVGNVLLANTARSGGGLLAAGGDLDTANNHFVANEATDSGAGVGSTGGHDSVNDVYAWNDGALAHENYYAALSYDLFFGNVDGDTDGSTGAGMLYADPLLGGVPPFACDAVPLEPGFGSPLIDGGDPATSDADGSAADIGAFGGGDPYPSSTDDADGDGAVALVDCDDADPAVFPGATEQCNGQDDDCDGVVPVDETDVDADGWPACFGDCDDALPGVHPGGVEIGCNTIDDDCDAQTLDQGDGDGDGVDVCSGDCDDADPQIGPDVTEIPADEIDEDCDGGELCHPDADHDGVGEPGLVDSDDSDCQDFGEARAVGDVCPGADDEVDPDDDGVPSGCDPCPLDVRDDSDGDGVCDHLDACPGADDASCDPGGTPTDGTDEDGDGVPDAVDPFPDDDGGGGLQAPPTPPGGCGCASSGPAGSIAAIGLACAIVRRRRPSPSPSGDRRHHEGG